MKFEQALEAMRKGKKLTRKSSALILGKDSYYFIEDGRVWHFTGISQTFYDCPFTQREVFAEDWEIVDG